MPTAALCFSLLDEKDVFNGTLLFHLSIEGCEGLKDCMLSCKQVCEIDGFHSHE